MRTRTYADLGIGIQCIIDALLRDGKLIMHGPTYCWITQQRTMFGAIISRLVMEDRLGRPVFPGYYVCHHCDDNRCINPNHLYEGTPTNNAQDRVRRGPSSRWRGSNCG